MRAQRSRRSKRIRTSGVAFVAGSVLVLAGCGGEGSNETVNLTIWTWSNEAREALEGGILEIYEDANPGVEVEVVHQPDRDYQTLLTTGLSGSGGPDIAAIRSYGVITSFADSGNLSPLDDVVSEWSAFSDLALEGVTSLTDGSIYAVPQGVQTAQVFYNSEIFDELELEVPRTWDEFINVSQAILDAGIAPLVLPGAEPAQIALAGEALGNARRGGNDFTEAFVAGETDLNHPDNIASIELMQEIEPYLVDNVTAVTMDEAVTLFATGSAAMFPSGTWQVTTLANLGADIEYGTFNAPANPDWPADTGTVSYADGGWALAERSEHPEEAADLLEWLASAEFATLYSNAMGTIPARDGATLENPQIMEMYERFIATPATYMGAAYLRYGNPWGTDIYGEQVQHMWHGNATPTEVAEAIQLGIDAWFDPNDFGS